jgi:hypothetical protein
MVELVNSAALVDQGGVCVHLGQGGEGVGEKSKTKTAILAVDFNNKFVGAFDRLAIVYEFVGKRSQIRVARVAFNNMPL